MQQWIIATWRDDETGAEYQAPSFKSHSGVWYRAGASDHGGPTVLRVDGEPVAQAPLTQPSEASSAPKQGRDTPELSFLMELLNRVWSVENHVLHLREDLQRMFSSSSPTAFPSPHPHSHQTAAGGCYTATKWVGNLK